MSSFFRDRFEKETGIAAVFANRTPYIQYITWLEEMKAKEIYDFIRNNPAKELKGTQMIENYAELLREDIDCAHKFLDENEVPREKNGKIYSLVGRIKFVIDKLNVT